MDNNPFTMLNQGANSAPDTWINRIFGPPIAVQTQQAGAQNALDLQALENQGRMDLQQGQYAEEQRKEQRSETIQKALAPAFQVAMKLRQQDPNMRGDVLLSKLLQTPEGMAALTNPGMTSDEAVKQLMSVVHATYPPKPDIVPMAQGTTVGAFTQGQVEPGLKTAGVGSVESTQLDPAGNPIGTVTTPGKTFAYPSNNGLTDQFPKVPWRTPISAAPPEYQSAYVAAAQKYNLPPDLLTAQGFKESRFDPAAISKKGAVGLAQFMPATAAELGFDPTDPLASIDGQGRYMRQLLDKFDGNYRHALMAYNWGMGNVQNWLDRGANPSEIPDETRDYVNDITGSPAFEVLDSAPGQSLKQRLQNFPNRAVTAKDIYELTNEYPGLAAAGAGFLPFVERTLTGAARQLAPGIADDRQLLQEHNSNKLKQLTYLISVLPTKNDRIKGSFEAAMKLDPSSGSMFVTDPLAAIQSMVDLYEFTEFNMKQDSQITLAKNGKKAVEEKIDRDRVNQNILDFLGEKEQLEEVRDIYRNDPQLIKDATSTITNIQNVTSRALKAVGGPDFGEAMPEALPPEEKGVGVRGQRAKVQPIVNSPQPGPQVKMKFTRDANGNIVPVQ